MVNLCNSYGDSDTGWIGHFWLVRRVFDFATQPQPKDKRVAQKLSDMKHILPQIAPEAPPLNQYFAEELLQRQQGKSGFYPLAAPMDALAARLFLIDHAQVSLDVQYYLYHDDLSGSLVARHLVQAADRGVKVRMLLDDWMRPIKTGSGDDCSASQYPCSVVQPDLFPQSVTQLVAGI